MQQAQAKRQQETHAAAMATATRQRAAQKQLARLYGATDPRLAALIEAGAGSAVYGPDRYKVRKPGEEYIDTLLGGDLTGLKPLPEPVDYTKEYVKGTGKLTPKGKDRLHEQWRTRAKPYIDNGVETSRKMGLVNSALNQRNGTADIGAIMAYQKMIDEGVVRSDDVALQGSAVSMRDELQLWLKNKSEGDMLPETTRQRMRRAAKLFTDVNMRAVRQRLGSIKQMVTKRGELDFDQIVSPSQWKALQADTVLGRSTVLEPAADDDKIKED